MVAYAVMQLFILSFHRNQRIFSPILEATIVVEFAYIRQKFAYLRSKSSLVEEYEWLFRNKKKIENFSDMEFR